jgi:hypothetical protein
VWAAAVVLAALGLRSSCFTAADLALLTLHRRAACLLFRFCTAKLREDDAS